MSFFFFFSKESLCFFGKTFYFSEKNLFFGASKVFLSEKYLFLKKFLFSENAVIEKKNNYQQTCISSKEMYYNLLQEQVYMNIYEGVGRLADQPIIWPPRTSEKAFFRHFLR